MLQAILEETTAEHSGASSFDIGDPALPSSSRLYLEVDDGPAAESLGQKANLAMGESSHDPHLSPKVVTGQGLNESLETITPATQSASATGQTSRPTPNFKSKSFPVTPQGKSKTDGSVLRRMTSSTTDSLPDVKERVESISMPNLSKSLRQLKADRSLAASARSFRYGGLSWSTRLKLWFKDLVD